MCQICTIATRYSRRPLDRTQPETQVFHLNQFSTTIQTTRSEDTQPQVSSLAQTSDTKQFYTNNHP